MATGDALKSLNLFECDEKDITKLEKLNFEKFQKLTSSNFGNKIDKRQKVMKKVQKYCTKSTH